MLNLISPPARPEGTRNSEGRPSLLVSRKADVDPQAGVIIRQTDGGVMQLRNGFAQA